MLGKPIWIAAFVVAASLAGCIGAPDEGDGPVETPTNESFNNVIDANESTEAPDGRGDLSAFKETNKTETGTGGMMHAHDYWKGQDRLEIGYIDSGLIPFPLFPCKAGEECSGTPDTSKTYPAGTAIADYDLEPPHLVYEGTKQLELLLQHKSTPLGKDAPEHPAVTVNFDYLTAADEPRAFRTGGTLEVGVPFVLPIKPTEADMPHQTKSLWIFRIYSNEPTWFEFNISITAVKGNEIVDWPPHPDLYADKSERLVYDGPVKLSTKGTIDSNLYGSDAGWLNPERIISYGTDRLELTVTNVKLTTDVPGLTPTHYLLEYHNATKPPLLGHGTQYGGRLQDEGSDGTTYTFNIDLRGDEQSYDTPYGTKSRWGFRFVPQFDMTGAACVDNNFLQQLLVGCQFVGWQIEYNLVIKAYGHSTAAEALPEV